MQNKIIKFKSHSFKEKIYFKRKAIKQTHVKIKPSLTKHWIKLLKDANALIKDNPGTFSFHMLMYTGIWKFVWKMQVMDGKW